MLRLLIVDDEEFEREGMAQLIDWKQYGIEMVGTAWNGVEGLEKTRLLHPDIILTDIKMPVMDGIELIREVHEIYPDIEFAVLSGYGEYEFTSKAMEQGVRHYILKPCDENKITEVIDKVRKDVETKRERRSREEYFSRMAPQAGKQLFRDLLLDREEVNVSILFRLQAEEMPAGQVRLLCFRGKESFDGVEEFVLGNIAGELLENQGMKAFLSTVVRNDTVLLISDMDPKALTPMVRRIRREFLRVRREPLKAAVSDSGTVADLARLYRQIEELYRIGEELKKETLLHYGMFDGKKQDMELLIDFDIVGKTRDYAVLLQSLQLTFLRMQKRGLSFQEKRRCRDWAMRLLYGEGMEAKELENESGQDLMILAARQIWRRLERETLQETAQGGGEDRRFRVALEEIYRHFQDQKLSLHYLATEILYVNEDYFGRFFQKKSGKRFTRFLLDARVSVAEQLMRLEPDIMVYTVSEMTGYAADRQYFSRIFKKSTGMTPSEYREKVQRSQGREVCV